MTGKLAWVHLFEAVSARFVLENVPAVNLFGWRIPAQHPKGNRIAWVPGDPNGIVGTLLPPRNPGSDPRSLGTLGELFTIIINGQDPTDPENEMRQYEIVRYLRDAWFRAAYHAAYGTFTVRSESWVTARNERRHGAALKIGVELQAPIPDEAWPDDGTQDEVLVDQAVIDVHELDVTEQITVTRGDE
jgi:hypothetical protein